MKELEYDNKCEEENDRDDDVFTLDDDVFTLITSSPGASARDDAKLLRAEQLLLPAAPPAVSAPALMTGPSMLPLLLQLSMLSP